MGLEFEVASVEICWDGNESGICWVSLDGGKGEVAVVGFSSKGKARGICWRWLLRWHVDVPSKLFELEMGMTVAFAGFCWNENRAGISWILLDRRLRWHLLGSVGME